MHQDRDSTGAGGAHRCSDSPVAAASETKDNADICTVQQIKVQYCYQNGEFLLAAKQIFTAGSSKLTMLAS